jgi:hypothetical protein
LIEVIGNPESAEGKAAYAIVDLVKSQWSWLESDQESQLYVMANVQCHGQSPKDLDIVLLGIFAPGVASTFRPHRSLVDSVGNSVDINRVTVVSLCLVIEVKDHGPEGVRFAGSQVSVKYCSNSAPRWHDATDQNHRQLHSLRNYLARSGVSKIPWVTNLIWLSGIEGHQLPKVPHNILHARVTWNGLLDTMAQCGNVYRRGKDYVFSAGLSNIEMGHVVEVLSKKLIPSPLDRRKMDAMLGDPDSYSWFAHVGKRQVVLQGRGGTGKTMVLLQTANSVCNRGHRALVLTYNKALVADLRRLMAVAGISDDIAEGTIRVQTVQSFFHRVLRAAGLIDRNEEDFLESYLDYLQLLKESLESDGEGGIDQVILLSGNSADLDWDLVLIDEAQDWPNVERDLLRVLYDVKRIVVADGVDQMVRGQMKCDWQTGLRKDEYFHVQLRRGLRMKRNLARFANSFASLLGLPGWTVSENSDAFGGRVIVVEGSYFDQTLLHEAILQDARDKGNHPVDLLVCVPPSLASRSKGEGLEADSAAARFSALNQKTWDGTDSNVRGSYPTSLEQLRLVQYDSCRGLEGWVCINLGLDEFYDWKSKDFGTVAPPQVHRAVEQAIPVEEFVARWLMIALTRAIDTVVIELSTAPSGLKEHLRGLHNGTCADFMEWHALPRTAR